MFKKLLYWFAVGMLSVIIVVTIDTSGSLFTSNKVNKNTQSLFVKASSENIVTKPKAEISSIFRSISVKQYFIPENLTINSIGVHNSLIEKVGVNSEGSMTVPTDPNNVGWYKKGSLVGQTGNIVFAGHFDWFDGQKGVFYNLNKVQVGDKVEISGNNKSLVYQVYETKYVPIDDEGAVLDAFRDSTNSELTLITCGGVWDNVKQSYDKRFLVKAILIVPVPKL